MSRSLGGSVASQPIFSLHVDPEQLAPPGISGDMWSVQKKPETTEAETRALLSDPTEREFEVRCVCFRDSGFARDVVAQTTFDVGTSFFEIPDSLHPGFIQSDGVTLEVVVNQEREIAGFRSRVRASSPLDARSRFTTALAPVLDHLAYIADTPLAASSPSVHDEKNLVWVFGYTSPYHSKVVNPGMATLYSELAPVYGLYREAKNASSPFYRFFCYYKILEGVFCSLRQDVFRRARKRRVSFTKGKEVVPDHPELRILAPNLIGQPIRYYFDNTLRKQFRDAVAHYILDSGRIVTPSDPEAVAAFVNVILPAELCCRIFIEQHERYLSELNNPPSR